MAGRLAYSSDLFERGTVERMTRHFARLAAGVVAEPDLPLSQVTILSEAERDWELVRFNQTARPLTPACVHELVDALGVPQPLVSQHLKILKAAGVVTGERSGREVLYQLADHHLAHIVVDAVAHASEDTP